MIKPTVDSVNVARPQPNPYKKSRDTGIGKRPVTGRVAVRAPGPKQGGLGSGLVGDFIGDTASHGGDDQAVYAFMREDLDAWQQRLDRTLPNGFFGENLTTVGFDVNEARVGERWLIGEEGPDQLELQVTGPRIPCSTFRGWIGEKGWLKTFAEVGRTGAYLRVIKPGTVGAGDPITISRPRDHQVSVALIFRATTTERQLLPKLLEAGDDLPEEFRRLVATRSGYDIG